MKENRKNKSRTESKGNGAMKEKGDKTGKKSPQIVFMGTPDFAVESLKALIEQDYNVVGVVTVPDKPAGRGYKLQPSPVKRYALKQGLPLLQPEKLRDPRFLEELKGWKADLQVVVAFRMLPEVVWGMPPMGTFNLHASLLPRYRGAAPINWAIINGESETGVTTFSLSHEIDTGHIIFQEKTAIGETDTAGSLHDRLMTMGARLVLKTVNAITEGTAPSIPQSELVTSEAILTPAPKIFTGDCRIDWNQGVKKIYNLIRGLSPYPAAWTILYPGGDEKPLRVKIYACEIVEDIGQGTENTEQETQAVGRKDETVGQEPESVEGEGETDGQETKSMEKGDETVGEKTKFVERAYEAVEPENPIVGSILTDNRSYLHVAARDGVMAITDLQVSGKKRLQVGDFLNGYKIKGGTYFQ